MWKYIIAGVAATTVIWATKRWRKLQLFKSLGIPGPKPSLIFGNLFDMLVKGDSVMLEEWGKKYGDFYGYYNGTQPVIVTSNIEVIRQVCIKDHHLFNKRKPPMKFPTRSGFTMLFHAEGATWKRLRKICAPFSSMKQIKSMNPLIGVCVTNFLDVVKQNANSTYNILSTFKGLTLDTISRCAFGMSLCSVKNDQDVFLNRCKRLLHRVKGKSRAALVIFAIAQLYPNFSLILVYTLQFFGLTSREWFTSRLNRVIDERRINPQEHKDFIDVMLSSELSPENEENAAIRNEMILKNQYITTMEMKAQSMMFMLVGFEGLSSVLGFAAYRLAIHPEIQDAIYQEIDKRFPEEDCNPSYEDCRDLVCVDQFIHETLRMHSLTSTAFHRISLKDVLLRGYKIPKDTTIIIDSTEVHTSEKHWKNPDEFSLERWSPQNKAGRDKLAFLAFGAGPRNCVGMRFALMECMITLIRLIHGYRIEKSDKLEIPLPEEVTGVKGPKNGVDVVVVPRR